MFNNQVRLVDSRCLYETILTVKPIYLIYLLNSLSQLALFVRATLKVEPIFRDTQIA